MIGTAAPVLALASVVAAGDVMRFVVENRGPEDPARPPTYTRISIRTMSTPERAYLLANLTLLGSVLLMLDSLWALASGRDHVSLFWTGFFAASIFLVMLIQAQLVMLARIEAKRRKELGPDG